MRKRGAAIGIVLTLALSGAGCGHPEQRVVDRYFVAINAEDNLTLTSMSVVPFKQKVSRWEITQGADERRSPVPLAELVVKVQAIEKEIEDNKAAAREYRDAHGEDWDQVENLKKDAAVPPKLQPVKAKYDEFSQKERDLRKSLTAARDAVQRERQNVTLSMTLPVDEIERQHGTLETLKGELVLKDLDLSLTIDGQPKPYVMTLRKYDLKTASGSNLPSRWVIAGLNPKA